MKSFSDDAAAFGQGSWVPTLNAQLRKKLLAGWRKEFCLRRGTGQQWIQFEEEAWRFPAFSRAKPTLMSSESALFVSCYLERGRLSSDPRFHGISASDPILSERMDEKWHWHGFYRCLSEPHLRNELYAVASALVPKRRVVWVHSRVGMGQAGTPVDQEIPLLTADDLTTARTVIDGISLDQWVNVIIGVRFSRDECVTEQKAFAGTVEGPLVEAARIAELVKSALP